MPDKKLAPVCGLYYIVEPVNTWKSNARDVAM